MLISDALVIGAYLVCDAFHAHHDKRSLLAILAIRTTIEALLQLWNELRDHELIQAHALAPCVCRWVKVMRQQIDGTQVTRYAEDVPAIAYQLSEIIR